MSPLRLIHQKVHQWSISYHILLPRHCGMMCGWIKVSLFTIFAMQSCYKHWVYLPCHHCICEVTDSQLSFWHHVPQYCTHHLDYTLCIGCLLCKKFRFADLNSYVTSHRRRITHIYISSYALQPQAFAYFLPTASILCLPLRLRPNNNYWCLCLIHRGGLNLNCKSTWREAWKEPNTESSETQNCWRGSSSGQEILEVIIVSCWGNSVVCFY